ncbi:MAG TPA: FAD-dependent oxidoreductase, partial [Anaerolineales bacterium]|nr:FAD-dependent oxidoreductase [Anaerolineales bacterium]
MSEMQTEMMKATGLSQDALTAFRMKLRGELIQPSDPQYEMARKVYNGMIDKHPALIVRPVDVADVSSAVEFATLQKLDVAVRGGSHNGPGFGTVEGGLVIDLSRMRGIRVDPDEKTVRVEGGALLGDVDHATYPFGLAVPSGTFSTTGVGGLTLGGGMGYLSRRYGLSIDNLLSVDMVLADGCFVTASKGQNEDLFWAVRGGGGNFGIVTSFMFQARPVATVYGGPMMWPIDDSPDLLPFWQELILKAPEELFGIFAFLTVPPSPHFPEEYHLKKMCAIIWCYSGELDNAEQVLKPIRDFRKPAIDMAAPIPFPALQSMFDPLYPAGYHWYWQSDFFKRFDDRARNSIIEAGNDLPT